MMAKKKNKLKIALIIIIITVMIIFSAGMAITSYLMGQNFSRGDYGDPRYMTDYYYEHYSGDYPRTEVSFKSGGNELKGFIYGGNNDIGLLVFAHGIGGGHEDYMKTLIWFVDKGWRVFGYDATGSGHSEGSGTRGLPQSALDLDAALDYIESDESLNSFPVFLMGHSWGGYAVTAVLNFDHEIAGSVSVAGYNDPMTMISEFADGMMGDSSAAYPFMWIYNKVLFWNYSDLSAVDGINSCDVPVMIIHGTQDGTIGYDRSSIIAQRDKITNPNVQYLTLDEMHSSMFQSKDSIVYSDELNKEYKSLYEQYGEIPDNVKEEFYAAADKDRLNKPNEEFLEQIEKFYVEILDEVS